MISRSLFIDGAHNSGNGSPAPSGVMGVVVADSDSEPGLPSGWVRVAIPANDPVTEVTAPGGAGAVIGARVHVLMDSSGRASHAAPVQEPASQTPRPTVTGLFMELPGGHGVTISEEGLAFDRPGRDELVTWDMVAEMGAPKAAEEAHPVEVEEHE